MRSRILAFALVPLLVMASCDVFPYLDDDDPSPQGGIADHTLVFYMMANSSLASYIEQDLRNIAGAVGSNYSSRAKIVVYYDHYPTKTGADSVSLLLLERNGFSDDDWLSRLQVLRKYPQQDPMDPDVMQGVMRDIRELVPSRSYGLVFSGHGTGWFPDPSSGTTLKYQRVAAEGFRAPRLPEAPEHDFTPVPGALPTRWLGTGNHYAWTSNRYVETDEDTYMTPEQLAQGLSPISFNYIIFDACFMASMEAIWDLRSSARYIICSPTEIMANGFPYESIIPGVFENGDSLLKVAKSYMDFYRYTSSRKSGAISVIDTGQIEPMADIMRRIYAQAPDSLGWDGIQALEGLSNHVFYDMRDYVESICSDPELLDEYRRQYDLMVPFRDNTEIIYSMYGTPRYVHDRLNLSGMSLYIPRASLPVTLSCYMDTQWAKATSPAVY